MKNLSIQDGDLKNIEEIRKKVNSEIKEERLLYPANEEDSSEVSSQDILTALEANEDGDAALFIRLHRDNFVFDHDQGKWFKWAEHYWQQDRIGDAIASVAVVIDEYAKEVQRQNWILLKATKDEDDATAKKAKYIVGNLLSRIKLLQTLRRKQNVLTLATKGNDSLGMTSEVWDANPWLLGCNNGVIDLKTGNFSGGRPEDYIKTIAPIEWCGIDTPAPIWEKFLYDVFDNKKELVDYIQRLLGYSFTGETIEHIFPIFWGKGRNGKGTLLEVLGKILGSLAGPVQSGMLLSQSRSRSSAAASPDIMALWGKRIVWASETNEGRHFDIEKVKKLVGDDTLTARPLYGNEIEFEPTYTLFLLTNNKPKADGDDYAFWKRVFLIPFTLSFIDEPKEPNERKRDLYLKEKLLSEASGILAWLVRGCLMWQKEGLNPPDEVKIATKEYQKGEDILGHYTDERCEKVEDGIIRAYEFYADYKRWCEDNGHRPLSSTNFGKKMSERYMKDKDDKGNFYKGISLVYAPRSAMDNSITGYCNY